MPTVRLTETHIRGVYLGTDGRVYAREDGVRGRCSQCQRVAHVLYRWADQQVCGRHVRVTDRTRIRLTTTFACRVFRDGTTEWPPATVVRRGDEIPVAGPPERVGGFDKFAVPDRSGFVLVPRSRWAWA